MNLKDFIEKVGGEVSASDIINISKEIEEISSITSISKKAIEELKDHLSKIDELTKNNNDKLNTIVLDLLNNLEDIKNLKEDKEAIKSQIGNFNSEAQKVLDKMQNDFIHNLKYSVDSIESSVDNIKSSVDDVESSVNNLESSVDNIEDKNRVQDKNISETLDSVKQNTYDDVQRANKQAALDANQDTKILALEEKINIKLKSLEERVNFIESADSHWDDEELILNKKVINLQGELKTLKNAVYFLGIVLTAVVGVITYHLIF